MDHLMSSEQLAIVRCIPYATYIHKFSLDLKFKSKDPQIAQTLKANVEGFISNLGVVSAYLSKTEHSESIKEKK